MNVVVCCKFVPYIQDMEISADGNISFSKAEWEISEFDLHAVQAGVDLIKENDGRLIAVSAGDSNISNGKLRKALLSRGPDELYVIVDDSLGNADTAYVSALLCELIKNLDADVVICGEGSADNYYQQMGIQLGERLGCPTINAVNSIRIKDNRIIVERVKETEIDTLSLPIPSVLSVTTSINVPSRPNMRAVLMAGKKPFAEYRVDEMGNTGQQIDLVTDSILALSSAKRKCLIIIEGEVDKAVAELIRCLKSDSILN